jgi:hypothetical protein
MPEPQGPVAPGDWPPEFSDDYAAPFRGMAKRLLLALIEWAGKA